MLVSLDVWVLVDLKIKVMFFRWKRRRTSGLLVQVRMVIVWCDSPNVDGQVWNRAKSSLFE